MQLGSLLLFELRHTGVFAFVHSELLLDLKAGNRTQRICEETSLTVNVLRSEVRKQTEVN